MSDDKLTAKYSQEFARCVHLLTELSLRLKKLRNSTRDKYINEEIHELEPKVKNIRRRKQYLNSELRKLGWK